MESPGTAIEKAEREGRRLIDGKTGHYDHCCPITSNDGSVLGWVVVYADEHRCMDDLTHEEAIADMEL